MEWEPWNLYTKNTGVGWKNGMEMWEGNRTFLVQSTKGERLVKTKKAVTTGSMHTPVDVQDPRRA